LGLPTTQTIQTLTSTTSTSTTTTSPFVQQGPVGQPAPTITGQTTVYQYTTTDAAGDTIVVTDTFTASFQSTQPPPTQSFTGSVLDYSSWLSIVGTNTVPVSNAALARWAVPSSALRIGAGVVAGLVSGVWLVLA